MRVLRRLTVSVANESGRDRAEEVEIFLSVRMPDLAPGVLQPLHYPEQANLPWVNGPLVTSVAAGHRKEATLAVLDARADSMICGRWGGHEDFVLLADHRHIFAIEVAGRNFDAITVMGTVDISTRHSEDGRVEVVAQVQEHENSGATWSTRKPGRLRRMSPFIH
jgi:hypothetical protein